MTGSTSPAGEVIPKPPVKAGGGGEKQEHDAFDAPGSVSPVQGLPDTATHRRVIYQLVVRTFSNTKAHPVQDGTLEQNGVGKFNDINDAALDSLRALGATDVWLTGVVRQATLTDHSALGLPSDDPDTVKGRAGSFYAVKDYFDVCPDYAENPEKRIEEFKALVDRIHAKGMRVITDFVPNHVARGYESASRPDLDFGKGDDPSQFFSPQNDFFYLPGESLTLQRPPHWSPTGVQFDGRFGREDGSTLARTPKVTGMDTASAHPQVSDWYETIKVNYGRNFQTGEARYDPQPSSWAKMDQVLAFWQGLGVDGFRCDFAHVVPNEAWRFLIGQARERKPDVYFYAEAYASTDELRAMLASGFDAVYDDPSTDTLKSVYQGQATPAEIKSTLGRLRDGEQEHFLRYLENHDERRVASPIVRSTEPNDSGFGRKEAAYQLAPVLFLQGANPLLIHNGQEVGATGAGREGFGTDDGRSSIFDYGTIPELTGWVNDHAYDGAKLSEGQRALRAWYGDLLALSQTPLALAPHTSYLPDTVPGLHSFARHGVDRGLMLVVGNFAFREATEGRLRLPRELVEAAGLAPTVTVTLKLDRSGAREDILLQVPREKLITEGIPVSLPDQSSLVLQVR